MAETSGARGANRRVRVRFAPSPTGQLHIGTLRTTLFTWLYARHCGGDFILRIEDTDRRRVVEGSLESILESLRWVGLDWDEGPEVGGPFGPYFQSERLPLYQEHVRWLIDHGHAYECFCSPERLEKVRTEQRERHEPPGYDRHCRNLTDEQIAEYRAQGITPVVRFKMPETGVTVVPDLLRGNISFENRLLEDPVILKSDGYPTYHLAAMVDDHVMEISHIMRSEEWIPSAPLHWRIFEAFGWEPPIFVHLPVVLNPDGKGKLSKRHGAVSTLDYRNNGYLPEAILNYLALLGWSNGDREIFDRQEMIERFELSDVNPHPARFNFDKLLWTNQYYINHIISLDELAARCVPFLQEAGLVGEAASDPTSSDFAYVREVVALLKDRMKTLAEAPALTSFFFTQDVEDYPPADLVPKKTEPASILTALGRARDALTELDFDDEEAVQTALRSLADELGLKPGQLFMPIRVAVTGRTVSPGLFETLRVLGKERALARLDDGLEKLSRVAAPTG